MSDLELGYAMRVAVLGMTRSGKSTWLAWLLSQIQVRRTFVDPKGAWQVDGTPRIDLMASSREAADAEVDAIDWTARDVHVKPKWGNRHQLEALYARIDRVPGPHHVMTDEAYAVSSANWAPAGLLALQVAGGGRGKGHSYGIQRPRNVATELKTEADVFVIFPPADAEDLREIRRGMPFLDQERALALLNGLPPFGHLIVSRRDKAIVRGQPLPPELLRPAGVRAVR